ncbi:Alpha/Beta hydrolase protein, partial [Dendryphion nanum]
EHSINVGILYSKKLDATPSSEHHSTITRFHGGGLVSDSSLFVPSFAPWILQRAERHSAVIVSPIYQLIPESCVRDTLDDIEDIWALPSNLQQEASLAIDITRIMTTGDSAGGYLSLQLGLSHPDQIRAVTASYPSIDVEHPRFFEPSTKCVLGMPWFPKETLAEHVSNLRATEMTGSRKVVVPADPNLECA